MQKDMSAQYTKILVVEDDSTLRSVIVRNLEVRGHVVLEAETATEAAVQATNEDPDLILLDINLPDMSGWNVLRELRQAGKEIPTIVISAVRVMPDRLAEFKPLAYLPKPFPLDALLRVVETGQIEETEAVE
jgi:DNA-binding response OmpR family regulator